MLSGVSHSQNLSRLIFDMATVNCETQDQYNHLIKKRYIFHSLLVIWIIFIGVYIYFLASHEYEWAAFGEMFLFFFLGIQLLVINFILLRLMNRIFGAHMLEKNFKHENRFLISTLILFSVSYLVGMGRNLVIFWMIENEEEGNSNRIHDLWCSSNFEISLFNIGCYTVTELIPYVIIFILNFGNYR